MKVRLKGGPGSGHRGHAGRPGQVGGSLPGVGGVGLQPGQPLGKWESGPTGPIADMKASNHLSEGVSTIAGEHESWQAIPYGEAARVKADIVTAVVDHTNSVLIERGLPALTDATAHEEVNLVIKQWAHSSNDNDMRSLSLQEAAAEEFGFEMSDWQKSLIAKNRAAPPSRSTKPLMERDRERAILRGMYNNTQEELRKAGYKLGDQVKLFRGVRYEEKLDISVGATVLYKGNGMESWSVGFEAADAFAVGGEKYAYGHSVVLGISVPVDSILSTAKTGFGCLGEGEFVIFGNIPNTKVSVEAEWYTSP